MLAAATGQPDGDAAAGRDQVDLVLLVAARVGGEHDRRAVRGAGHLTDRPVGEIGQLPYRTTADRLSPHVELPGRVAGVRDH
jgi:hypothetical protein